MSTLKTYLGGLAPVFLLVLAGCASNSQEVEPQVEAPVATEAVQEVVVEVEPIKPMVSGGRLIIPLDAMDATAGSRTLGGIFYFDFDQAIVRRDGHSELDQHAIVLAGNSRLTVRLEGHADERGTREYNLALGERRANAIQSYLLSQGAMRSQIEVVSYGEEKPAMSGHDQLSWEKNRRVEIVYR